MTLKMSRNTDGIAFWRIVQIGRGKKKKGKQTEEQIVKYEKSQGMFLTTNCFAVKKKNKQAQINKVYYLSLLQRALTGQKWSLLDGLMLLPLFFAPNENRVTFIAGLPVACHQVSCAPAVRSPSLPPKHLHRFTAARALLQSNKRQWAQPPPWWFQPHIHPKETSPTDRVLLPHCAWDTSRELARVHIGNAPSCSHPSKAPGKSNRAKGTAVQSEMDEGRLCEQGDRMNFRWLFESSFLIFIIQAISFALLSPSGN